jgi:outer membrane protein assembly factor BamD (BamD/ComL family)
LGIYEEAIRMLQKGRSEDARKSLKDLIDSELLQTIDNNVMMKKHRQSPFVLLGDTLFC